MNVKLHCNSSNAWLDRVMEDFDEFLIDHAANERKASAMAMTLVAHYPDRQHLVSAMVDLALEELGHFRQVIRIMQDRDIIMTPDEKDPYVNELRSHVRRGSVEYLLDRLLSAAIIEARGEERFRLISVALSDQGLKRFYVSIANSEQGHHQLFIELAEYYFDTMVVQDRLNEWLEIESSLVAELPIRPRLH